MKNLTDFSSYISDLSESILASAEDALTAGDNYIESELLTSWMLDDKCKISKKKNGYILKGDFKMRDYPEKIYNGPKILKVQGNFSINNTQLTSLENLFDIDADVIGTFNIEDNNNLVSLKGCPSAVNTLCIVGNKNLKNIDVAPVVYINAYISKNGKKFKKEELQSKINVYKHIFCSQEDENYILNESEVITESFKAPQLKLVADAIKNVSKDVPHDERVKFSYISNIPWDKIESSDIIEMEVSDSKCLTLARAYISGKQCGIMFVMDKNGDPIYIIYRLNVIPVSKNSNIKLNRWTFKYKTEMRPTEIIDIISRYGDTVLFINTRKYIGDNDKKYRDRWEAKKGALALQKGYERTGEDTYSDRINIREVRYYQNIADENRERYKKQLIKLKAQRASTNNVFITLKNRIDQLFDRYSALLVKVSQNPNKYMHYEIQSVHDLFHAVRTVGSGRNAYSTSTGLFTLISNYMDIMIDGANGRSYGNGLERLKDIENKITEVISQTEAKLTALELK